MANRYCAAVIKISWAHRNWSISGGEIFVVNFLPAAHPVHANGSSDVLQIMRTEIFEREIELVGDVVIGHFRHEDAPRLGKRLEQCGDVDPVAKDVPTFCDNVPEAQPDAHRKCAFH
jgi:hypothetical protein